MDTIQQQQLTLLARKALLLDELKQIENSLGQLTAIAQFAANLAKEAPAAPEPETKSED